MNRTKKRQYGTVQKKLIAGSLASALLFGGAFGAGGASVYAAAPAPDTLIQSYLKHIVSDTAFYADQDVSDVEYALKGGQTLVQASQMDSEELLDKLVDTLNAEIDAELGSALPADKLDEVKKQGIEAVTAALQTPGYSAVSAAQGNFPSQSIIDSHIDTIISDTALYADRDTADVLDDLAQGKTLIEASGLPDFELLAKLAGTLNRELELAASGATAEALDKAKLAGAQSIQSVISTHGYNKNTTESKPDLNAVIADNVINVIDHAAVVADSEVSDIEDNLASGQDLIQASGLVGQELLDRLASQLNQDINTAADGTSLSPEEIDAAKKKGREQLASVLTKEKLSRADLAPSAPVDYKNIIDSRLKRLGQDIELISDDDDSDMSAAELVSSILASGTSMEELVDQLAELAHQDLVAAFSGREIPQEKLTEWMTDAKKQIAAKLSNLSAL